MIGSIVKSLTGEVVLWTLLVTVIMIGLVYLLYLLEKLLPISERRLNLDLTNAELRQSGAYVLLNSWFQKTAGGEVGEYFDADLHLSKPEVSNNIADEIVNILRGIFAEEQHSEFKLCFVEKDSGPVGILSLKDLIQSRIGIPTTIIRVRRRLLAASTKGARIIKGDRVILVTDVVTSGFQTLRAYNKIDKLGAIMSHCVTILDRRLGTDNTLERKGIRLKSVVTLYQLRQLIRQSKEKVEG